MPPPRTREIKPEEAPTIFGAERTFVVIAVLGVLGLATIIFALVHSRSEARDKGHAACVAKGHDATYCDARADEFHERCLDLTYDHGNRGRPGNGLDASAYVECLELGDKEYWALSAKRGAERRAAERSQVPMP